MSLTRSIAVLAVLGPVLPAQGAAATELQPSRELARILAGGVPRTLDDFRAMERHLQALLKKLLPSVVNFGGSSGVIVQDGYVLSAGHCTEKPGKEVDLNLHDGRRIAAKTLGLSAHTDSGILRITAEGTFPALEMGRSADLRLGQWVVMLGHPGGKQDRPNPPVRLGRIVSLPKGRQRYFATDCTMAAGDSGGPVFDMMGRVIGTNSRIDRNLEVNKHVPIDTFRREWEWLIAGEVLKTSGPPVPGWLGLTGQKGVIGARVARVVPGSPAAAAGVKKGDRILKFGDDPVRTYRQIERLPGRYWPGSKLPILLERDGVKMRRIAVVGKDPAAVRKAKGRASK